MTEKKRDQRVLIVEDDQVLGAAIERHLLHAGYSMVWIHRGADLEAALHDGQLTCVLLDLGLPDGPGEELVGLIKRLRPGLPVVIATARGAIADRVTLLDTGAADYLVKPFDLDELTARLRAVTRRTQRVEEAEPELVHGPLKLLPLRRQVTWNGTSVQLTNKEYLLLELLMRRKNQVLTRTQLETALSQTGDEIGSNALEVYVHFLRRKFGSSVIYTVRGIGYQLGHAGGSAGQTPLTR